MIVLNEAEIALDPVEAAVKTLIEAAASSETNYTVEDLQDLVEEGVGMFSEAGGLISLIKRMYTGKDDSLPADIESEIPGIKNEAKKKKALAYIDKRIAGAERVKKQGVVGDSLNPFQNPGGVPGIVLRHASRSSGGMDKYISALKAVRAKVEAVKTES